MSTDELLDAQVEFERSRTTSRKLLDSLARKIGARRPVRPAAGTLDRPASLPQPLEGGGGSGSLLRFFRQPAIVAVTAAAAGYLLVTAYRHSRR